MKKQTIIVFSILGILTASSEGWSQIRKDSIVYDTAGFTYESGARSYAYYGRDQRKSRRHRVAGLNHKFSTSELPALRIYLWMIQAGDRRRAEDTLARLPYPERIVVEEEADWIRSQKRGETFIMHE